MKASLPAIRTLLRLQNAVLWVFALPLAPREPRRILLYRTARIGDFVVTIPAMVALRARYPDAEIVLLTTTSTSGSKDSVRRSLQGADAPPWFSFVAPSLIDRVVMLNESDRRAMLKDAREAVRAFRPDVAVLLSSNLETFRARLKKLLFFRAAGLRGPILGWRIRQSMAFDPHVQHAAGMLEHNVVVPAKSVHELPGMARFDEDALRFELDVQADVGALWTEYGLHGRRVVALFPGATFDHKRWPVDKYATVGRALAENPAVRLVVLGAETDRETTASLVAALGPLAIDLTGRLGLLELTAFLGRADLYVGSDTGPMHLSTAMGTPTVGVMNHQELSNSWEPWNSRELGLKHEVPCRGCYSFERCPLGTRECIVELPVERVLAACRKALKAPAAL